MLAVAEFGEEEVPVGTQVRRLIFHGEPKELTGLNVGVLQPRERRE